MRSPIFPSSHKRQGGCAGTLEDDGTACDVDEREPMRISFARAWSLSDYCIDTVCRVHVACIHMWAGSDPSAGHGSVFRGVDNT
jgi:hypothetical protein